MFCHIDLCTINRKIPFWLIAGTCYVKERLVNIDLFDSHLVLCQCSCLIRTDHRCRPQCFNTEHFPDKRILSCHFTHSVRKGECERKRQPFRNGCNSQCQGNYQHTTQRCSFYHPEDEYKSRGGKGYYCKAFCKV